MKTKAKAGVKTASPKIKKAAKKAEVAAKAKPAATKGKAKPVIKKAVATGKVAAKKAAVKVTVKKPPAKTQKVARKPVKPVKVIKAKSATKSKVAKGVKEKKLAVSAAKPKVKGPAKQAVRQSVPAKGVLAKKPVPAKSAVIVRKKSPRVVIPAVIVVPPVQEAVRKPSPSGAMKAFEHAVRVFNKRMLEEARAMFENVVTRYHAEVEFVARSQTYIQICNQKLVHHSATPRNADELYDRGVFALNIGDFQQAKSFFEKALRLKPDEPHLLYSLAATHAQTGSLEQAIDYLKKSILIQPRLKSQALNDADFSGLRENKQFQEMLGLTSPFSRLELKR
ncbi:MAG: tetratricopeptide repeat protein [Acidobacteria bacterium]|nr:tetratricopeptide repeat protein [Acidobacteriota bacterium]